MLVMLRGARPRRVRAFSPVVVLLAVAVLVGIVPVGGSSARADTGGSDSASQLQEDIGEASAQLAAAMKQLQQVQSRRAAIDADLHSLDSRIAAAQSNVTRQRALEDRALVLAQQLDAKVQATDRKLNKARGEAVDAAAALYRGDTAEAAYAQLLDVSSLQEAAAGGVYLKNVSGERRNAVTKLSALSKSLEGQRRAADKQRAAARAARDAAASQAAQLTALRSQQATQRSAVAAQELAEQKIVATIQAQKNEYENELATMQASSSGIAQMLYARQKNEPRGVLVFANPPVHAPITSPFGLRFHPILHVWRMHSGVDLGAAYGTPVKAVADGVVVSAGPVDGYGDCVIIDHGNQYATLYAHASALEVTAGEQVHAGQTIMMSGNSGLSTGPHLHFEVRLLGTPIDPVPFLGSS